MRHRSLKSSFFSAATILVVILLLLNLLYICISLNWSENADAQVILGHRILHCAILGPVDVESKKAKMFAVSSEYCDTCKRQDFLELDLLLYGGMFAGRDLPRIEVLEMVVLIESMRLRWRRLLPLPASDATPELALFCSQAQTLNDALMLRAIELKASLWLPVWSALVLVLLLLLGMALSHFFISMKSTTWIDYVGESQAAFESQLLLALPVPFVLLDEFLSIKFVNRSGESYFGQNASSEQSAFERYCCDQALMEHLRSSMLKTQVAPCVKLSVDLESVVLKNINSRECQVAIQWYKLYLSGRNYLLGEISDLEAGHIKELNFEISQERLRELSQNLFRVQDDERQYLADELHDGLCQSLAALKMQVFQVEKGMNEGENQEDCRKARQFIAQIIEDVRRLSHDLSPVILEDLGLSGALAHLVNNFAALNDLKVSVAVPDLDGCFSTESARNIYRIVQEAVNNVAKHAQASLLVLEADVTADSVHFQVRDDGVGFGGTRLVRGGQPEAGLGLTSMAQRVRLMDGDFSVSASPGEGCVVDFTLPRK